MKFMQTLLIAILLVAVGVAYRQLHNIEVSSSLLHQGLPATMADTAAANSPTTPGRDTITPAAALYPELVKNEAEAMARLVDQPEEVQKRLRELAAKMQESDLATLQESALNPQLNGDHRFLAIYLLGESALEKAQASLETIAISPIPKLEEARMVNQEEILRGHAVESLRETESLKRVLAQVDNGFITDRAQRNLLYREGKVSSSPEQQDQEALSQLLKKNSR